MRVLKDASRGVSEGTTISPGELGLPVGGTGGLLIVFWKER
jgi:hypothetical protein